MTICAAPFRLAICVAPGHPFEDLFKDFDRGGSPQKRKTQSLGSGFIIDKEGIIITNKNKKK